MIYSFFVVSSVLLYWKSTELPFIYLIDEEVNIIKMILGVSSSGQHGTADCRPAAGLVSSVMVNGLGIRNAK